MEYYRNYNEIIDQFGVVVDADSLWEKQDDIMVLVNDDEYISVPYDEAEFYEEKNV
ncbi:MAG: hypothetical protein J6O88_05800 [Chryseobacterium sp.]|uniref:hypothetical protein n=1 Tax=Chryseobacterium sp. TaxID=1871047 RepID=UPI001AFCD8EC|nr:hypothetical protein [Chryseobacterium sp.]MBO6184196.1 hypothetical protein [Chryseobacterium sp.]